MVSKKKTGKYIRKFVGNNLFLRYMDQLYCKSLGNKTCDIPPIFIIGAPRSGTTLVYQVLIKEFDLLYFSNLTNVFYGAPCMSTILFKNKLDHIDDNFSNNYGYIKGLFSPSEAGPLNEKWFEYENKQAKYCINSIISKTSLPIVLKNVHNTTRVGNILKLFPNSLIIHVDRKTYFTAQSIILNTKSYDQIDRFYNKISDIQTNDYYEKAIETINYSKRIKNKLHATNKNNLITINYEEFCENPDNFIINIYYWFLNKNIILNRKNYTNNLSFKISNKDKLSLKEASYLKELISKLSNENNK